MTEAWTSREQVKNKPANAGAMNLESYRLRICVQGLMESFGGL